MIRYSLLGGTVGPVPWEMFVTMGGSLLAAAALFPLLFPLWSTWPLVGVAMTLVFATPGIVLLLLGAHRRKHDPRKPRVPNRPPGSRP